MKIPQNPDAILRTVETLAQDELDFDGALHFDTRLIEDLQLDSIRLLTLATAVEDHFRICLDEEDEASIRTAGDLVARIQAKLDAGDSPTAEPSDA